jgi:hypothetical protein
MPQELAQQAGIDEPTAERGLEGTFKLLGEQLTGGEDSMGLGNLLGGLGR